MSHFSLGLYVVSANRARKDTWQAGKVGIGTFIGFIIGTVAKIGCALTIALTILFVWLASLF